LTSSFNKHQWKRPLISHFIIKHKASYSTTPKSNIKEPATSFSQLLDIARPELKIIGGAIGFLIISTGVTMAIPSCIGIVMDVVQGSSSPSIISSIGNIGLLKGKLSFVTVDNVFQIVGGLALVGALANTGRSILMKVASERSLTC
jgi:putative ABC transport system ATP-binding protein